MAVLIRYFRKRPLDILLLFAFIAPLVHWFGLPDLLSFAFSAVALIPLAGLIGRATESLAVYTGPKIGGLLNATCSGPQSMRLRQTRLHRPEYLLMPFAVAANSLSNGWSRLMTIQTMTTRQRASGRNTETGRGNGTSSSS